MLLTAARSRRFEFEWLPENWLAEESWSEVAGEGEDDDGRQLTTVKEALVDGRVAQALCFAGRLLLPAAAEGKWMCQHWHNMRMQQVTAANSSVEAVP